MVRLTGDLQRKRQRWLALELTLFQFAVVSAWGQAGALDTSYSPNPSYVVSAVTIQPDGKALIGGAFGTVNDLDRRYLVRLNADGTVDTGFVPANIEGEVRAVALQPDGKILVGGQFSRVGGLSTIQVARLQTNGLVDATFTSALSGSSYFRAMSLQRDGKVLVVSEDLDRLMPDGSLDTNFQRLASFQWITNGDSMVSAHNSLNCVAELSDGKILVGGYIAALYGQAVEAGLIRLNVDGTWDTSFHNSTQGAGVLLVQPDNRIVVGRNGWLSRVNSDGTLDGTFASSSIEGDVMALARQPDGKILMGGYYQRAVGLLRPGIARFNVDGTLDRNFDAGDVSGFTVTSIALQADTRIVMGGFFTSVNGQSRPYLARLQNDNLAYPGRFEFLSVSNAVTEAAGNMLIPVIRYAGSAGTASVAVATYGWGSAWPGQDYLLRTQTLVFLPGQTSNAFIVPIMDDVQVEGPYGWETFEILLSAPTGGASLGTEVRAIGHILEDDTAIGFAGGFGATEAAGEAVIGVVRLGVTNLAVGASFQTVNGSAIAPDDFIAQSGTITFAAGETNKSIIVVLNDDALVEGEETFDIRLTAPTGGASLANSSMTVYITDDVSFMAFDGSPTVTETDGQAAIKVRRWGRTNNTVSAHFTTSNLSALAGSDYQATSGTLTLLPGEIEGTITVPIIDDASVEAREEFQVRLTGPTGTLVLQPFGTAATVSVISDDGAGYPDTRFRPVVPGGRVVQFALTPGDRILVRGDLVLTNGTLRRTVVRFNPDGSSDPTFQCNLTDDVHSIAASADGKVYVCTGIGIGTSVQRLLANGQADRTFDPFYVDSRPSITAPVRAMAVQADGKVLVSAYPGTYYGYESATNLLNRLNVDGTYDLAFGPVSRLGNETLASAPDALALQPDGKLLLAARLTDTNGTSRVRVARLTETGQFDGTFSPPEITGWVRGLRALIGGKFLVYGVFTAINGTARPGIAVLNANGALDPSFVPAIRAPEPYENGITAVVVQGDGKVIFGGEARLVGGTALSLGRLNVNGSVDASFRASPFGVYIFDLALQADGKVLTGGSIGPFFGTGLERLNNDPQVGAGFLEFSSPSRIVDETETGITVTVRRIGGTNGSVRVPYATIGATATASTDFVTATGIIDFAAGELGERTITISLQDDILAEGNESFLVSLGLPLGGATWGENAASTITLRDNDTVIQFVEGRLRVRENAGAQIVNVQRLGSATGAVSVDYATSDITARAGLDYAAQAGTLSFGDGETNQPIVVIIHDDQLSESEATLALTLSHPSSGVMLGTNTTAEVTIVDNDRPGTLDQSFDPGASVCSEWGWGVIQAVAVQADGRIFVGGYFSSFSGVPCRSLVRLLPGGAVDPSFVATWPFPFDPVVKRIVPQRDGRVLSVVGWDGSDYLVRLKTDGLPDNEFGSAVAEPGDIRALLVKADGGIFVAGRFDTLKGAARTNLARLNADGSLGAPLDMQITAVGEPGWITALASDTAGRLVMGGVFDTVNGVTRHNLARLDTNGVLDLNFSPPLFTNVLSDIRGVNLESLAVQTDGKVVVGGTLGRFNDQVLPILTRLNSDGLRDTTFSVVLSNRFYDSERFVSVVLCQPDNRLVVGGHFTHVNGVFRRNLARLHADGSLDLSFQSGEMETEFAFSPNDEVSALALQPDGQLLVGGHFSELDDQSRCGIARLNGVKLCLDPLARNVNGPRQIRFTGTAGAHYSVLASSDLIQWTLIGAAVETAPGTFAITDPDSALQPRRFYRLRQP